jgi:uncharacterized protein (DUF433 family)
VTAAYERAGLASAEIESLELLVVAVEAGDPLAPWVAVRRADVLGTVGVLDRLVDRSAASKGTAAFTSQPTIGDANQQLPAAALVVPDPDTFGSVRAHVVSAEHRAPVDGLAKAEEPADETRIVVDDAVMGGVPCVRGTRIPVGAVLAGLAEELDPAAVLADFPQLARHDLSAALVYAAIALGEGWGDAVPKWRRMLVGQLLDQLDDKAGVIGLMNLDRTARAFVLKATPGVVRLIEDLTMRADVPEAAPETTAEGAAEHDRR